MSLMARLRIYRAKTDTERPLEGIGCSIVALAANPWLIYRLAYARKNQRLHVRGYKEKGNINTPMELAMNNEIDRFSLAIDAIDRVPRLQKIGAHAKENFRNEQIACRAYAYENGIDRPEITGWKWPHRSA